MRVGWLFDRPPYIGGAELTQAEFRALAPDDVEIIDCHPGAVAPDLDTYAIFNCVAYSLDDLRAIEGKPIVKYWNDTGPWMSPAVRKWLDTHARTACCSPLQVDAMGLTSAYLIPPSIDLEPFAAAAASVNGNRRGLVSVGSWQNPGKAPRRVAEWAITNRVAVDFYGDGPYAPPNSRSIDYEAMPELLAHYQTFVFLPTAIEPFCRTVAEAWAAGCELVINDNIGARYWIEHNPGALLTAGDDLWKLVLDA